MIEKALQYCGRGWRIFPVHTTITGKCSCGRACGKDAGKHPRIKAWQNHATSDRDIVTQWFTRWPDSNIGVATGSGLIVLDLDGAEEAQKFAAIAGPHGGLPETLTALTGRGLHVYLAGDLSGSKKVDGLLVRGEGGYVIAPPSLHASGRNYQWIKDLTIASAPDWFMNWVQHTENKQLTDQGIAARLGNRPAFMGEQKAKVEQQAISPGSSTVKASEVFKTPQTPYEQNRIVSALAVIPASIARDPWLHVGMALHALAWERSDGTDIGLELWDAWSATCPDKYSRHDVETRWRSFGKPGRGGITIGSLFHLAKQHGWQEPAPTRESIAKPAGMNGHYLNGATFPEIGEVTDERPLIELNEKFAAIGDIGGKCLVLGWVPSKVDETIRVPSFQAFQAFTQRYASQYVSLRKKKGDDWEEQQVQVGAHWLKWKHRRSFEGIDLVPGQPTVLPGNFLNLWCGFAVEPKQGNWDRMKQHIVEVLADNDPVALDYIMRFAAWKVQNPGERSEVALVFRGDKGTGKGTFANALKRMFGQHGLQIFNSKHLVGAFNGHLRNCLLLFADEAFWAGDKQGESTLKGLITEQQLMIEQKGVDATPWKNRLGIIMSANAEWVIPASHDERRFAMFNVNNRYAQNESYFGKLHAEIEGGGLAAMLWDLQHAELGGWHPRRVPNTEALREQKARSMSALHEWYESMLQEALIPQASKETPDIAPAQFLLTGAREAGPRLKELSGTALGRFLSDMGCVKLHRSNGNAWRFPEIVKARAIWEKRFAGWRWEQEPKGWQART